MSTAVYKYALKIEDVFELDMPRGAYPLFVAEQQGQICLWARVNPELPKVKRRFRFAGTGHILGDDVGRHVGSVLVRMETLVFHVFDMGEAP
jgi:hypothetical protein